MVARSCNVNTIIAAAKFGCVCNTENENKAARTKKVKCKKSEWTQQKKSFRNSLANFCKKRETKVSFLCKSGHSKSPNTCETLEYQTC